MISNIDARAKKLSERRDKLVNTKKRMGKTKGTVMSEDQGGKKGNPFEKMYARKRHP